MISNLIRYMRKTYYESAEPFMSCDFMHPYADIVLEDEEFKINQEKLNTLIKNISTTIYRPINCRIFIEHNIRTFEHFDLYDFSFVSGNNQLNENWIDAHNLTGKYITQDIKKNKFLNNQFCEIDSLYTGYIVGVTKPSSRIVPIIFIDTTRQSHLVSTLNLVSNLEIPFILITSSNSDNCFPYREFPCRNIDTKQACDRILNSKFLMTWYTKNPSIIHPKIKGLPLGPKWQFTSAEICGESKETLMEVYSQHYNQPEYEFYKKNKHELVYFNFAVENTDLNDICWYSPHFGIRRNINSVLLKNQFRRSNRCAPKKHIMQLKNCKFCFSPPGRGLDCHRHWESLLVGTIPIMQSSPLDSVFDDLPVVLVEDWNIVTKEFLEETYEQMIQKTYNFEKLYSNYWKNLIFTEAYSKIALNGSEGALNL